MRPEISHALFVASPSAYDSVRHWLDNPSSPRGLRIARTIARYFSRMSGRATPFGLFAGFSTGTLDAACERTQLRLGARSEYRLHARLDHDYIERICAHALANHHAREALSWRTNDTIYNVGGRYRYIESHVGISRSYNLVEIAGTSYLAATLKRAAEVATFRELVDALVADDPEIDTEEAEDYIHELISTQILVSDLSPALTADDSCEELLSRLATLPEVSAHAAVLKESVSQLNDLSRAGVAAAPASYEAIASQLASIPVPVNVKQLFQVDMSKPLTGSLSTHVLSAIEKGIEALRLCTPPRIDTFRSFRERFVERYERAIVPLVQVLDEESGIGFDRKSHNEPAMLEGLPFDRAAGNEGTAAVPRDEWLVSHLVSCLRNNSLVLNLTMDDLRQVSRAASNNLPDSFAVSCLVGQEPSGHEYVVMRTLSGPSGARMLGRFCAWDDTLTNLVRNHMKQEEALAPDAAFAEIVHQPSGRLGNIQARPYLRDLEIPIMSRPSMAGPESVPVTDLMVTVVGDRVVLLSERLQKEIVPRMATAHNYQRGVMIYRFLCALQAQDCSEGLAWSWGSFRNLPFLPRVVCEGTVLSRARWQLAKPLLKQLQTPAALDALNSWRAAENVPRWVLLSDGDNELPVDLDNADSVDMLLDLVATRSTAIITEMLPSPDDVLATGPEGRFVAELIVPFIRTKTGRRQVPALRAYPREGRTYLPSSDWCFLKLYCGQGTADRLLIDRIGPLASDLQREGIIDKWFFLRYSDPDWHLRVRFHGARAGVASQVLERARLQLAEAHLDDEIWRAQLDTYNQEVERYGGPSGMPLAEEIFHHDSIAVVRLLRATADQPAAQRWRLCVVGFDFLLEDMGFDLESRARLFGMFRDGLMRQVRGQTSLRKSLAKRFREERKTLGHALAEARRPGSTIGKILEERSRGIRPIFERLHNLEERGELGGTVTDLAPSYLHMSANRLLRASSQQEELVMYDFLAQLSKSQIARQASSDGEA